MLVIFSMLAETPFVSKKNRELDDGIDNGTLTGHMRTGGELGGHGGVNRDHDFSPLRHQLVALLDLRVDPVLEGIAKDSGAD